MSLSSLKAALKEGKVVFGTEKTLKALKNNKVVEVFVSKNCPDELKESIEYYGKLNEITISILDIFNDELGSICKKPFSVSVCYC
ncbi:50S ribosomal protein L30 [archaeon]|jgi:large subunit ribosomal protein L30e|nr:50S ribosomal protein L30 [archaeon]